MNMNYAIERSLASLLYRTSLAIRGALQRTLKERGFDITPEQFGILRLLWEKEGLSQREIANILFKDKPNVSRMLDVLKKKKLIYRKPTTDRRKFAIFLTETGTGLVKKIYPIGMELRKRAFHGVKKKELEHIGSTLNKIFMNIS